MNKYLKWSIGILCSVLLIYCTYWVFVIVTFSDMFPAQNYSKLDLIKNYDIKSEEINELKIYTESIVKPNEIVEIEFEDDNNLFIFHSKKNGNRQNNWSVKINSLKCDTILNDLQWTREKLKILKEKLDKANCISVSSEKPFTVGYQRSGMGMYFYKIFDKPLTDSLKKEYNDGCTYIFYKKNVVLKYSGGAIGMQCFENFRPKSK